MNRADLLSELRSILTEAEIPRSFPPDSTYRLAGIGALTLLSESLSAGATEAAELLIEAAVRSPAEAVRVRALRVLEDEAALRKNPAAIDALFALAIDEMNPEALAFLKQEKIESTEPRRETAKLLLLNERERLLRTDPALDALIGAFSAANDAVRAALLKRAGTSLHGWAAIAGWIADADDPDKRREVIRAFPTFNREERACFFAQIENSPALGKTLLADLFLTVDDDAVRERCVEFEAVPSNPVDNAVYFYLIENWARYEENDVAFRALLRVFDGPDTSLQVRLIAAAARSGDEEWLAALHPDDRFGEARPVFSLSDWTGQFQAASRQADGPARQWALAQAAPLAVLPDAIQRLEAEGFRAGDGEERALFDRIAAFIHESRLPFPPVPSEPALAIDGSPVDFQLSGDGRTLAFVSANGRLSALDRDFPKTPLLEIRLPNRIPRRVFLSPDGKRLISGWSDRSIRIFDLATSRQLQQFNAAEDEIAAIWVQRDGRRLILIDRSSAIAAFSYPTGVELFRETVLPGTRITNAAFDPGKNRTLIANENGEALLIDIDRRRPVGRFRLPAPFSAFSDEIDRDWLASASGRRLTVTHVPSGKTILSRTLPDDAPGRIAGAALACEPGCVFALTTGGTLFAFSLPGELELLRFEVPAKYAAAEHAFAGLRIARDGKTLYLTERNGLLYRLSLVDFRLTLLPADGIDPDEIGEADAPSGLRELLRARLDWRRRFEIDLDFGDETDAEEEDNQISRGLEKG